MLKEIIQFYRCGYEVKTVLSNFFKKSLKNWFCDKSLFKRHSFILYLKKPKNQLFLNNIYIIFNISFYKSIYNNRKKLAKLVVAYNHAIKTGLKVG